MIILLTGTHGIGKTTLVKTLNGCSVLHSDINKNWISEALSTHKNKTVVVDLSHGVAAAISEIDEEDMIGFLIEEAEDTIKQRLESRGGEISPSILSRQNRLFNLAQKNSFIIGDYKSIANHLQYHVLMYEVSRKLPTDKKAIYKATSPSGKVYIGQTTKKLRYRVREHFYQAFIEAKTALFQNAIRKYGDLIKWEILEKVENTEELDNKEKYWIAHYNSSNPEFGYNGTDGGVKTCKSTSEAKRKALEKRNKDLSWRTPEVKAKISAANKGKEYSEEFRQSVSKRTKGRNNGMFGLAHSEETKNKMVGRLTSPEVVELIRERSIAYAGESNPFYGKEHSSDAIDKIALANSRGEVTDDLGNVYSSVSAASKVLKISETAVNNKIKLGVFKRKEVKKLKICDANGNIYKSFFEAVKAVGRSDAWIKNRIRDGQWQYVD